MITGPFEVHPVGVVRTGVDDGDPIAIQARLAPEATGEIVVDAAFLPALEGLAGFDFVWVVSLLHEAHDPGPTPTAESLTPVPFLLEGTGRGIGAFASRYPGRRNRIALSLVQILAIEGACIRFAGVDLRDGTPVLDIKPWVGGFDLPVAPDALATVRCGWYDDLPPAAPSVTGDDATPTG